MRHAVAALAVLSLLHASPAEADAATPTPAPGDAGAARVARRIEIKVTDRGFEPREIRVRRGEPVTLVFTRLTDSTCITAIDIPDEHVKRFALPLKRPVELTITPMKPGLEAFHCSAMAMGNGRILVE